VSRGIRAAEIGIVAGLDRGGEVDAVEMKAHPS
jgi:hypothetical protein